MIVEFIMSLILGLIIWAIVEPICFSNTIVSSRTYFYTFIGCWVVGYILTVQILQWLSGVFNCIII